MVFALDSDAMTYLGRNSILDVFFLPSVTLQVMGASTGGMTI
jgi:hypothetical protein